MAQKNKRPPVPAKSGKSKKREPQSAQQTIPYKEMLKDGICKVREGYYTNPLSHEDINMADRKKLKFANGLYLGSTGSGKSERICLSARVNRSFSVTAFRKYTLFCSR